MSPFQFQQLFTEWAGVRPEVFLRFINVQHTKQLLSSSLSTLFCTADKKELTEKGRPHDHCVKIEVMTPREYKNEGEQLTINYSFSTSRFGYVLIASTYKGICYMGFSDDDEIALIELQHRFPKASFTPQTDEIQKNALHIFTEDQSKVAHITLHLKATDFQLKVWETLLNIPLGNLTTYGTIARSIHKPKASRAVGTAIGRNPIAFLIPCHRVIPSTGAIGSYMWGTVRKTAIIGWEASKIDNEKALA